MTNRANNITPLTEALDKHQHTSSTSSGEFSTRCSSGKDVGTNFKTPLPLPSIFTNQSPLATLANNNKINLGSKLIVKPPSQQSLGFSVLPTSNGATDGRVQEKVSLYKQENKPRQMVPKTSKSGVGIRSQTNKGMGPDNRVAKPPPEGRVRSQLLPRYWPKITDQELLQISGEYPLLYSLCTHFRGSKTGKFLFRSKWVG